ncbi:MAG: adenylyl-sulfate kinase [Nitrospirae bacterium]|nr:adenylyl-sulfate kinase [Nitrospirota bacterium]
MASIVIWITGLPGSGKSLLADKIKEKLPDFFVLRMDELREIATPEPNYSDTERSIIYSCLVFTAKKIAMLGHNVLIDATGNLRKFRDLARNQMPHFAEIYLRCPIEVCSKRESERTDRRHAPKNIYKKGKAGWPVPGISAPYEEPINPELTIDTDINNIEQAVKIAIGFIKKRSLEL